MTSPRYFKAKKGTLLSTGKIKVIFSREVIAVTEEEKANALEKSISATEITEKEAKSLAPELFGASNQVAKKEIEEKIVIEDFEPKEPSLADKKRADLEVQALELGITEEEIRKANNKQKLIALMEEKIKSL